MRTEGPGPHDFLHQDDADDFMEECLGTHRRGFESPNDRSLRELMDRARPRRPGEILGLDPSIQRIFDGPSKDAPSLDDVRAGRAAIREGMAGKSVKYVQSQLGTVTVDGRYGAETKSAILSFQAAHGLNPDGVVGKLTLAALDSSGLPSVDSLDWNAPSARRTLDSPPSSSSRRSTLATSAAAAGSMGAAQCGATGGGWEAAIVALFLVLLMYTISELVKRSKDESAGGGK